MGAERVDRFTWERAVRDPKARMPRDLLCLALVLATHSTGKTGGDIEVSEETLCAILGYRNPRTIRRLMAELRDGYGVISRGRHGNQHDSSKYALVLPADGLAGRGKAVKDGRAADRARASRTPKARRAPGALRPVHEPEHRAHKGRAPGAQGPSTGRGAPPYQDQDQVPTPSVSGDGFAAPRERSGPTAQTILAGFIDWDRVNGGTLTKRTIGALSRQIKDLLDEGIDPAHIKRALAAWRVRGQHPSALHSFVDAAMAPRGRPAGSEAGWPPSRPRRGSDIDWEAAMARARARDAEARGELPKRGELR
jgi:hypothetical protein